MIKLKKMMTRDSLIIETDNIINEVGPPMRKIKSENRMTYKNEEMVGILEEAEIIGC
jgi:hypothetical protein